MNNINDVDTHHFFALDRVALAFVSLDLVTTCGSVMSLGPLKGWHNLIVPRWHVCSETSFHGMHNNGSHNG